MSDHLSEFRRCIQLLRQRASSDYRTRISPHQFYLGCRVAEDDLADLWELWCVFWPTIPPPPMPELRPGPDKYEPVHARDVNEALDRLQRELERRFGPDNDPPLLGDGGQTPPIADDGLAPTTDAEKDMRRMILATGDANTVRVLAIINRKDLSGEEKMQELLSLDLRYAGKNSNEWATLLGVSSNAVRNYGTWTRLREAQKTDD